MTISEHFKKASPDKQRKLRSGALVAVIHIGRKQEGSTTLRQKVDANGDPLVRFINPKHLAIFEEYGWRKAAIPKDPVSGATDPQDQPNEEEETPKRGRKKQTPEEV